MEQNTLTPALGGGLPQMAGGALVAAGGPTLRPSMRIMLEPHLFGHVQNIAKIMARAEGITPRHLIGRENACFSVIINSLDWGLNPFMVAGATYETRGGKIGYMAVLVHAIMQASGQLDEPLEKRFIGDWTPILGKYEIRERVEENRRTRYAEPTWTDAVARECGAGVRIDAVVRKKPIAFEFLLYQAWPRHSVLWATDPQTQLYYAALRRFANAHLSSAMMGLVIEGDDDEVVAVGNEPIDVTPAPPPTAPPRAMVAMAERRRSARSRSASFDAEASDDARNAREQEVAESPPDREEDFGPPPGTIFIRVPGEKQIRGLASRDEAIALILALRRKNAQNPEWAESLRALNAKTLERHPELAHAMAGPMAQQVEA